MRPSRRLPAWKKALFAAVALMLAMATLEGAARLVQFLRAPELARHASRAVDAAPRLFKTEVKITHPTLHHTIVPNADFDAVRFTSSYRFRTNSMSWMETYEVARDKPAGTFRVFMLGDSNTQAVVDPGDKWSDRVEEALAERYAGSGTTIEVINAGRSSYSPLLHYLALKQEIMPFAPDLVVINVDMTDVVNDMVYRRTAATDASGDFVTCGPTEGLYGSGAVMTPQGVARVGLGQRAASWLIEHSVFVQYARNGMRSLGVGRQRQPDAGDTRNVDQSANWLAHDWTPSVEENVAFTLEMLTRTAAYLRERGVRMAVASVPHHPQYSGVWSTRPHDVLEAHCRELGVPFLNLYRALEPAIAGTPADRYYYEKDPTHFNVEGNALWAAAMTEFLTDPDHGLLPPVQPR